MKNTTVFRNSTPKRPPVLSIIIFFGIISMLGDMVHEAARSVNGQYLSLLGVTAAQVGLVFGLGEFLGYALRIISGSLLDKTGKHWLFMFVGYGLHLFIPFMGITQNWNLLFTFILMERIGKALRSPAKDTLLSVVADKKIGVGYAFGLQEALDQLGAFAGPLIFTAVFYFTNRSGLAEFQQGYRWLAVPFVLLMLVLFVVYRKITAHHLQPETTPPAVAPRHLQPVFWIYSAFTFFATLGFVSFALIGYHLKANEIVSDQVITLLYAGAMIIDAVVALLIGKTYDRLKTKLGKKTGGILVLLVVPILTLIIPLLVLGHSVAQIAIGMVLVGIVLGAHETVMRSAIADLTPMHKRGIGFGLFNTFYGLALMLGASLMGYLYDRGLSTGIILICVCSQLVALAFFWVLRKRVHQS